ncbi:serine protease inhibitor [Streptomyces sp. NBC_00503]|uniref:serine protease inhibitor n=1 Tax=Streptomyces sp. NBC_00503 TaxID=2903659 RepID=UPI002E8207C2|nr:serine protease inhibitor [Streptomyces sp. NBC_00503]WUD85771.1 serine protease inhibitor [Streptomyces sp. NBC_00503]
MRWPELTGKPAEEAREQIRAEFPEIAVHAVPDGSMVTMDFNEQRVRLFVKETARWSGPPRRGIAAAAGQDREAGLVLEGGAGRTKRWGSGADPPNGPKARTP